MAEEVSLMSSYSILQEQKRTHVILMTPLLLTLTLVNVHFLVCNLLFLKRQQWQMISDYATQRSL